MKYIIIFITAVVLTACQSEKPTSIATYVMADRTDPNIPMPDAEIIKDFCFMDIESNGSVELKFQNITNTDVNESFVVTLGSFSRFGNKLQRSADIYKFYRQIDTLIYRENVKQYNYHSSSIIVPVLDKLTELSKSDVTQKQLILMSDLSEFSDIYNVYDFESELRLRHDPAFVAKAFSSKLHVPNLEGVTLHIMYLPKTNEQNRLFQRMVRVYRMFFKSSGLDIKVGIDKNVQ